MQNTILFFFVPAVVVEKHNHSCSDDDEISQDTESVRHLAKQEKSQQSGKNNLRIIINGYFFSRRIGVGRRDRKLSSRCRKPCKKQVNELNPGDRMKIPDHKRNTADAGKCGEEKDDERPSLPSGAKLSDTGVGASCKQSSQESYDCWKYRNRRKAWFYNKHTADKCGCDTSQLEYGNLFSQNQIRKYNHKKRRQFVQRRRIGKHQMVYRIKIAKNT